jgi:hypothetical protein
VCACVACVCVSDLKLMPCLRAACLASCTMSTGAPARSSDGSSQPNPQDVDMRNADLSAPPGFVAVAALRQVLQPTSRGNRSDPSPQRRVARRRNPAEPTSSSQPSTSRSRSAARVQAVPGPDGPRDVVMPPEPSIVAVQRPGCAAPAFAVPPGPAAMTPEMFEVRPERLYVPPRYALQRAFWAVDAAAECVRVATLRDSTRSRLAEALDIAREAVEEALTII